MCYDLNVTTLPVTKVMRPGPPVIIEVLRDRLEQIGDTELDAVAAYGGIVKFGTVDNADIVIEIQANLLNQVTIHTETDPEVSPLEETVLTVKIHGFVICLGLGGKTETVFRCCENAKFNDIAKAEAAGYFNRNIQILLRFLDSVIILCNHLILNARNKAEILAEIDIVTRLGVESIPGEPFGNLANLGLGRREGITCTYIELRICANSGQCRCKDCKKQFFHIAIN